MIAPGADDFAAPLPKKVNANKTPNPGPGFASNKYRIDLPTCLLVPYLMESEFRD